MRKIADSGLIIAALDARDPYHSWALKVIEMEPPPWFVCEPVLTEIATSIGTPAPVLEMLAVGDLEIAFELDDHKSELLGLVKKYRHQDMDLADACVVRMSEVFDDAVVYTVDKAGFGVYRRRGRQRIPCVFPD